LLPFHTGVAVAPAISAARADKLPPPDAMDDIDRRILELLREDASRPLKVVAAKVELSRSSVRERIARLEASGVIRRYTIELAPTSTAVLAILMVRLIRTPSPAVVSRVVGLPEVVRCFSLSGDIDLLVEVSGADVAEINRVRDLIASDPGVADVETSFVLKQDKAPS
jgi:Lrp/AsnC family transcriptional regulator, leucine-responsive regulatory protein